MATKFLEAGTDATQDLKFFAGTSATNGTIASATDQKNDGTSSLKSNVTLSGGQAYTFTPNAVARDAGTRISAWVRFSTVAPATNTMFMGPETASDGSTIIGLGITTGGKLRVCGRGDTAVDGTTALSANTWYRLTLSWNITSASVWTCKVYLNGILEITTGNAQGNLGITGASCVFFGIDFSSSVDTFGTAAVMTIWIDSIYIDDGTGSDDPGEIHVTAKRPFSNGSVNGFTTQIGSGGSSYGSGHAPQVNEQPLSITNGWSMIGAGSAVTEEYTIENASTGDVDITGATIVDYIGWVYAKSLASETGSIIVNNVTSNVSLTSTSTMFTSVAGSTTYPATGTDIGIKTDTSLTTVSLYECGIMIAYIPGAAPAITTPSAGTLLLMNAG